MAKLQRYDAQVRSPIPPDFVDEDGFLRVRSQFGKVGVQTYTGAEVGGIFSDRESVNILRTEEEVFSPESMRSLEGIPGVVFHQNFDPAKPNRNQVGQVAGQVMRSGDFLAGSILITDPDAVIQVRNRELEEFSLGYSHELDATPGIFQGTPYDAIMRNIKYNHVALLPAGHGRAGPEVRVLDNKPPPKGDQPMDFVTMTIPGVGSLRVHNADQAIVTTMLTSATDAADALATAKTERTEFDAKLKTFDEQATELGTLKAEKITLDAKIKTLEDEAAAFDPAATAIALMEDATEVETVAAKVLDAVPDGWLKDVGIDGLKDQALTKHFGEAMKVMDSMPEDQRPAYRSGLWDSLKAVAGESKGDKKIVRAADALKNKGKHITTDARQGYLDRLDGKKEEA